MIKKSIKIILLIGFILSILGQTNANYNLLSQMRKENLVKDFDINKTLEAKISTITNNLKEKDLHIEYNQSGSTLNIDIKNISNIIDNYGPDYLKVIRVDIIKKLVELNYDKWNPNVNFKVKEYSNGKILLEKQTNNSYDDYILKKLSKYRIIKYSKDIGKIKKELLNLFFVYFNKDISIKIDLNEPNINYINDNFELEYLLKEKYLEINSFRERLNIDKKYRLENIGTAFSKIGNSKYLLPGESFSFINSIDYDESEGKKNYKYGSTIVGNKDVKTYGGGLCGASTAIYQGILTNKGLKINQRREHSWWTGSMYTSNINGKYIQIPGNDSTVFMYGRDKEGKYVGLDLNFTNITKEPIFIYKGIIKKGKKSYEQVFTISNKNNTGSFKFIKRDKKCYYWNINGKEIKSCYKIVS